MATVFAFHTAEVMIEQVKNLFDQYLPDVTLRHILDDSILPEILKENQITQNVINRMEQYFQCAVDAGADLIFNTCSSVGKVVEIAQPEIVVPIVQIDHAMAEKAVRKGTHIGVLATLPSTLDPTNALLLQKASQIGKTIYLIPGLAEGAFDALRRGEQALHDELIMQTAKNIASKCDVVVLAQGSMVRVENQLEGLTQKEILSSPKLGVLTVKSALKKLN